MGNVRRIYVEKKTAFAVKARELKAEIRNYLGIEEVTKVRVLVRYDIENVSEETYKKALVTVFSEPPLDDVYEESFDANGGKVFSVEYLPGQFDQRADSAQQCVKLLAQDEEPVIHTAMTYIIKGEISPQQLEAIKEHCINPVDSRCAQEEKPDTLVMNYEEPEDVKIFEGFTSMDEGQLKDLYESLSLAMTLNDFKHIYQYFANEEHRDPSMTEIRVLDTYWSDHCRHTTFSTELSKVTFQDGYYKPVIEGTYQDYLDAHKKLYQGRDDKFVCLMDIALLAMKQLKADGKLTDQEESDEINACSIVVPIDVDGQTEEWLVNFKNETHNHPTEIEPFGGAATCLGGAIRDPLSGRTYVYQAMRVTGAADPTLPVEDTLQGKLPQRKIVTEAAGGYSSYGNQIGLATGYVKEIYHPDYVAKRMEIGAVMGAAPRRAVQRLNSDPGDIIILLGGRTGRDGCGGATGSSKAHTTESIDTCGAEVQKGNAPTERKIQRLFRREEVSFLIKKCNDFGAGGVSVAIGELADGLLIDLDKVPKKYAGLDGTELAISESQERMAVVVDPKDVDQFLAYAKEENLEATKVAVVTQEPRLVLLWRGKEIVNLKRSFLDTNGAHQETSVEVEIPKQEDNFLNKIAIKEVEESLADKEYYSAWMNTLVDLNVCSQKGLVEQFDGSIGAGSVLMPYGGKFQLTETQSMVAKIPVQNGKTDAVSMMAYGFEPKLSSWSPYHGAIYAVLESVSRIVAAGGDHEKIHFTYQEYFKRMTEDPKRWSQPFTALLGAYQAQMGLGLASIGGKDSMSGSFNEIDVPPTLVSFSVDVAKASEIITPEFKKMDSDIVLFEIKKDEYDLPDFEQAKKLYQLFTSLVREKAIVSAYALDAYGIAAALAKMSFGNKIGITFESELDARKTFMPGFGNLVAEVPKGKLEQLYAQVKEAGLEEYVSLIAHTNFERNIQFKAEVIELDDAIDVWTSRLEEVYPTRESQVKKQLEASNFEAESIYICKNKVAKPRVFIPVFPGTNCEYDSARAFENAGADVIVKVFKNLTASDIKDSVDEFTKAINQSQILMFPGGFSAGDEPEGSAKFFATAFRNEKMKEAVMQLINQRDGLALGICNGFQALIKLGLVPYGEIRPQDENSPTLTYNTVGRHISKMVYTKVVSNKSPWLAKATLGHTFVNPASHGEGRFVAPQDVLKKLFENGQVATRYVDALGRPTTDEEWNVNGSYLAIEGITSPDGRILGKMAHSERRGENVALNIYGKQDMGIFESGVEYFK